LSSQFERAVDDFLAQIGQSTTRITTLNRIWKAFMAFCMCIIAEAFRQKGYTIIPQNCVNGFLFKCFPAGDPNNYSYFAVERGNDRYEIRLNITAQNLQYHSLRLNLDIAVIRANSIDHKGIVDSQNNLITFAECKNFNGYPQLVATLEGIVYELQRNRLYRDSQVNFRIPCCLLLSGRLGSTISYINRRFQERNMSIRIFGLLQPGSQEVTNFIQNWF